MWVESIEIVHIEYRAIEKSTITYIHLINNVMEIVQVCRL